MSARVGHVDGYEHMKSRYQAEQRRTVLLLGLLLGLIGGLLWEAVRR